MGECECDKKGFQECATPVISIYLYMCQVSRLESCGAMQSYSLLAACIG
jgi:hypothetical protein